MKQAKITSIDKYLESFPCKENQEIFRHFQEYLKSEGKSWNTRQSYEFIISYFLSEMDMPVSEINYGDVYRFKEKYKLGKESTTINNLLTVLSIFFKFSNIEEYTSKFPLKLKRWRPKMKDPTPKYLNDDQLAKARIAISNFQYSRTGLNLKYLQLRDRCLFETLVTSGGRVSEIINLNVEDINIQERMAKIKKTKGKRERYINFSEECMFLLIELIGNSPGKSPVFLNYMGTRMSRKNAGRIIQRLGKLINLDRLIGPHVLRHTFGARMTRKGAPLTAVQDAMGHNDPRTTLIYTRIPDEHVYLQYKKCKG